jgi:hypothetical protein
MRKTLQISMQCEINIFRPKKKSNTINDKLNNKCLPKK